MLRRLMFVSHSEAEEFIFSNNIIIVDVLASVPGGWFLKFYPNTLPNDQYIRLRFEKNSILYDYINQNNLQDLCCEKAPYENHVYLIYDKGVEAMADQKIKELPEASKKEIFVRFTSRTAAESFIGQRHIEEYLMREDGSDITLIYQASGFPIGDHFVANFNGSTWELRGEHVKPSHEDLPEVTITKGASVGMTEALIEPEWRADSVNEDEDEDEDAQQCESCENDSVYWFEANGVEYDFCQQCVESIAKQLELHLNLCSSRIQLPPDLKPGQSTWELNSSTGMMEEREYCDTADLEKRLEAKKFDKLSNTIDELIIKQQILGTPVTEAANNDSKINKDMIMKAYYKLPPPKEQQKSLNVKEFAAELWAQEIMNTPHPLGCGYAQYVKARAQAKEIIRKDDA